MMEITTRVPMVENRTISRGWLCCQAREAAACCWAGVMEKNLDKEALRGCMSAQAAIGCRGVKILPFEQVGRGLGLGRRGKTQMQIGPGARHAAALGALD